MRKKPRGADSSPLAAAEMQASPRQHSQFDSALLATVLEAVRSCQTALVTQRQVERESVAVATMAERLHQVQRRAQELERRFEEELQTALERAQTAEGAAFDRLVEGMRNEMRERIGFLLDEQHVALRQLSLQTAEDAARVDHARRAAEARLQEAARRLDELARTVTGR
jgi:hypothetical protein